MNWEEAQTFADMICEGFTQDEIEYLENFAEWGFGQIEKHGTVGELDD